MTQLPGQVSGRWRHAGGGACCMHDVRYQSCLAEDSAMLSETIHPLGAACSCCQGGQEQFRVSFAGLHAIWILRTVEPSEANACKNLMVKHPHSYSCLFCTFARTAGQPGHPWTSPGRQGSYLCGQVYIAIPYVWQPWLQAHRHCMFVQLFANSCSSVPTT